MYCVSRCAALRSSSNSSVIGRITGVPVRAAFTCPDPRTVTMEIVDGEGAGSVVETHATPLRPGPDGLPRTAVIEAVIGACYLAYGYERTAEAVVGVMVGAGVIGGVHQRDDGPRARRSGRPCAARRAGP